MPNTVIPSPGILLSLLLLNSAALGDQPVTIYGDINYPPYSFEEEGRPKGIYVNILGAVFARMPDYDVEIKMIPWKRGLEYVKKGEAVAVFPPYYVEERIPWMSHSEPILSEEVVVFGNEENLRGKTEWPDDFLGSKIGLNTGYDPAVMGGTAFAKACKNGNIVLHEAYTTEANLHRLQGGKIQFFLNVGETDITSYPQVRRGPVVNRGEGYLRFTRAEDNFPFLPKFKAEFNALVTSMKRSGEIDKLAEAYWK